MVKHSTIFQKEKSYSNLQNSRGCHLRWCFPWSSQQPNQSMHSQLLNSRDKKTVRELSGATLPKKRRYREFVGIKIPNGNQNSMQRTYGDRCRPERQKYNSEKSLNLGSNDVARQGGNHMHQNNHSGHGKRKGRAENCPSCIRCVFLFLLSLFLKEEYQNDIRIQSRKIA